MGCGKSKLKRELAEITEEKEKLLLENSDIKEASAVKHDELSAEIKRAEKELAAQKTAFERLMEKETSSTVSKWTQKWQVTAASLLKQQTMTEAARNDAKKMRTSVIKLDDMNDENSRLHREKAAMTYELSQIKEELRLTLIIFEGQRELLDLEKQRAENHSESMIERESDRFKELERQLNLKVVACEENMEVAQRHARVQTEAALQLMRQSLPHGSVM